MLGGLLILLSDYNGPNRRSRIDYFPSSDLFPDSMTHIDHDHTVQTPFSLITTPDKTYPPKIATFQMIITFHFHDCHAF